MRLVYGIGRVTKLASDGFGLEFKRLHKPLEILPNGPTWVPDLTAYEGMLVNFTGLLDRCPPQANGFENRNLETPRAEWSSLRELGAPDRDATEPTELTTIVSGNLGDDASTNPAGDRASISVPYYSGPKGSSTPTAWIQVCAEYPRSEGPDDLAKKLLTLKKGTRILAAGMMTSYDYNGKPRLHVQVKGFDNLGQPQSSQGKSIGSAPVEDEPLSDEVPF